MNAADAPLGLRLALVQNWDVSVARALVHSVAEAQPTPPRGSEQSWFAVALVAAVSSGVILLGGAIIGVTLCRRRRPPLVVRLAVACPSRRSKVMSQTSSQLRSEAPPQALGTCISFVRMIPLAPPPLPRWHGAPNDQCHPPPPASADRTAITRARSLALGTTRGLGGRAPIDSHIALA